MSLPLLVEVHQTISFQKRAGLVPVAIRRWRPQLCDSEPEEEQRQSFWGVTLLEAQQLCGGTLVNVATRCCYDTPRVDTRRGRARRPVTDVLPLDLLERELQRRGDTHGVALCRRFVCSPALRSAALAFTKVLSSKPRKEVRKRRERADKIHRRRRVAKRRGLFERELAERALLAEPGRRDADAWSRRNFEAVARAYGAGAVDGRSGGDWGASGSGDERSDVDCGESQERAAGSRGMRAKTVQRCDFASPQCACAGAHGHGHGHGAGAPSAGEQQCEKAETCDKDQDKHGTNSGDSSSGEEIENWW